MRKFFRGLRCLFSVLFVIVMVGLVSAGFYISTTGIVDQIQFRREQAQRDIHRQDTATALAPTLVAESALLASYQVGDNGGAAITFSTEEPSTTPVPDSQPTVADNTQSTLEVPTDVVNTVEPTDEPVEPTAALTDEPTGEPTTPAPSRTLKPEQSAQPFQEDTPTATATTPAPSKLPTDTDTDTPEPPTATPTKRVIATTLPTNTQRPTAFPTNTFIPTKTLTPSVTPTPSDTFTPSPTYTPSDTLTPSPTFTYTPTPRPTLVIEGTYVTPIFTPITEIVMSAPLAENDPDIINIVLLGGDTSGQTDVIILVSINKKAESVAMWHIPRDLLVYIPGDTINRVNLAFATGNKNGWTGGGAGLMKETFKYNFGIEVDFYARVDFNDFKEIIGQLGGLEISVDCPLTDWRLIDPETPAELYGNEETWEQYWEQYTIPIGVQTLNPYMALWYARSRVTTNDLDRGRRQMDILRAIYRQAREQGIFSQVTDLWPQAVEIIETDMQLEDVLGFVPLALTLELSDIERYNLEIGVHMDDWFTPDDGRAVLLPRWDAIRAVAQQFVTPPTNFRLAREAKTVEVYDGTYYGLGWGQVAAERLAWEGFAPKIVDSRDIARHDVTLIYDFTGEEKGSELKRLQSILRVGDPQVQIQPDPNRTSDYRVVVGTTYNACIGGSSTDEVALPDRPVDVGGQ